jgi:ribosomal protein S18 acetylase RimI-like enzyme
VFIIERAGSERSWLEAAALVHDHVEWMRGWTDFDPLAEQPALSDELGDLSSHYGGDDAAVFVARWHELAVGSVAVRCHGDGAAELKRMYVRPYARGKGLADLLVDAAVAFATARGCDTIWLETVRGAMDPAIAVYRRNRFVDSDSRPATLTMHGLIVLERDLRVTVGCGRGA